MSDRAVVHGPKDRQLGPDEIAVTEPIIVSIYSAKTDMDAVPWGQSVHGVVHLVGSAARRVATQGVGAVRGALGWSSPEESRPLTDAGRDALVGATAGMIVNFERLRDDLKSAVPDGRSPLLPEANFEMSAVRLRSILLGRCDLSGQLECLLPILDCLAPGTNGCRHVRNLLAHTVEKVSQDLRDRLERQDVSNPTTATAIHTTVTKVVTAIGELTGPRAPCRLVRCRLG
jgi:hypothetical protein